MSSDGRFIYTTSPSTRKIAQFNRDTTDGTLTFVEIGIDGTGNSFFELVDDIEVLPSNTASVAAVVFISRPDRVFLWNPRDPVTGDLANGFFLNLPNQTDVVVVPNSTTSNAVILTSSDGIVRELRFNGNQFGQQPTITTLSGLPNSPMTAAVSPDGTSLYLALDNNSIRVYTRNPAGGFNTNHVQIIRNGVDGVQGLSGITDLVVSDDGNFVYVTGRAANALVIFARDADDQGRLTFAQRLVNRAGGVDGGLAQPSGVETFGNLVVTSSLGDGPAASGLGSFLPDNTDLFAATDVPLVIPDRVGTNLPVTITSTLTLEGVVGSIADVDVTVDITHGNVEELFGFLVAPDGTRVDLFSGIDVVSGNSVNFVNTVFDDESGVPIGLGNGPFTGHFRPEGSLGALDGIDPNGTWTLELTDLFAGIEGTLNGWSLNIVTDVSSTDVPVTIPVDGTATPGDPAAEVTSQLVVSGVDNPIADLNVTLDISHTFVDDLDVFLIAPNGTRVELFTDVGGDGSSSGQNFRRTTLDDEGPVDIGTLLEDSDAPFTGRFQPEGSLAAFNGVYPNGTWTLEIVDDFLQLDGGTLNSWSLTITQALPRTLTIDHSGVEDLIVRTGGGSDAVTVRDIVPVDLTVDSQDGGDLVVLVNTPENKSATVALGEGDDNFEVRTTGDGSTLTVRGQDGVDTFDIISLGADTSATGAAGVFGGDDDDLFRVFGNNIPSSSPLHVRGEAHSGGDAFLFDFGLGMLDVSSDFGVPDGFARAGGKATVSFFTMENADTFAPPVITSSTSPTIAEGQDLTLTVNFNTFGDTPDSVVWDLNGDGVYGDASFDTLSINGSNGSATVTIPWEDLSAFGLGDGDATYTVGVRVTTDEGSGIGNQTFTVDNVLPLVEVFTSQPASIAEPFTINFSVLDQGDDTISKFEVSWGDFITDTFGPNATSATHVYQELGNKTITVRAFDEDGIGSATLPVDVLISPSAILTGGPYTVNEGGVLTLDGDLIPAAAGALPQDDVTEGSWDLNGDGVFGDAPFFFNPFGFDPTPPTNVSWDDLQALGIDDNGVISNVRIRLTFPGPGGLVVTSNPTTLTVLNTAPTAQISNTGPIDEGGGFSVSVTNVSDPSGVDTAAGFMFALDADNDGVFESGPGIGDTFVFGSVRTSGVQTIAVRVFDKDGGFRDLFTNVEIREVDPTLDFSVPPTALEGIFAFFGLDMTDPGADVFDEVVIDWGDGTDTRLEDVAAGPFASLGFAHAYPDDGLYEIEVTAVGDEGVFTTSASVIVENVVPTVTIATETTTDEAARSTS